MLPSCSSTQVIPRRKHFGDLRTFKADIALLNICICMGFQDLLA